MSTHRDWGALTRVFDEHGAGTHALEQTRVFAAGRLDEGRRVGEWLLARHPHRRPLRVLDIGAGNGGVSLGTANYAEVVVHSIDIIPNRHLLALRRVSEVPMHACVGAGERLPFAAESFDAVLCLETLEHVPDAAAMAAEIMRVLRPGGECMITTPARLRYLFARDPHYGIPGLLWFGDRLQRLIATYLFRVRDYDVVHIFWRVGEIVRLFRGASGAEAFWNRPYPSARSRQRDAIWHFFRNLQWDRIVITK